LRRQNLRRKSLLLLALALCLAQVSILVFNAQPASAQVPERYPLWSYQTGGGDVLVSISSDGSYIAAGSSGVADENVYLFSRSSSTPLWSYEIGDWVNSVAISSDGNYIAAASGSKVYLFSRASSTPLWSYTASNYVWCVSVSSNGSYIVAGDGGVNTGRVYLFSRDSSTPLWSYQTGDLVNSVAISSDGNYIAVGGGGSGLYLFGHASNTPLWVYVKPAPSSFYGYSFYNVSISSDGNYVAAIIIGAWVAGNVDFCGVSFFNRASSTPLWTSEIESMGGGCMVTISSGGSYMAAAANFTFGSAGIPYGTGGLYLFSRADDTPLWNYAGSDVGSNYGGCSISSDGSYIVFANKKNIHFLSRASSTPIWSYDTGGGSVNSISMSSDGSSVAAGHSDGRVFLFSQSAEPVTPITAENWWLWLLLLYFIISAILAAWVYRDSKNRKMNRGAWTGLTFLTSVVGLVAYVKKRKPRR
jgi:outer membrane protein assembly factor BamB